MISSKTTEIAPASAEGQSRLRGNLARRLRADRVALTVACVLIAGYLWSESRDAARVEKANVLALSGDYADAVRQARQVQGTPAEVRALLLIANAHFAAGRYRAASTAFAELARRDPENWMVRLEWSRVLLALGWRRAARDQLARAKALNPRLQPVPGF